jgi:hypothetical protein
LIAEGGTGKSFLMSRWPAELKDKKPAPYAGAERIFTWSFYSQGSKGQITSSEGFFSDLLRSFGEKSEDYDWLSRADKALELVSKETMILVLDGAEPLQNPPATPMQDASTTALWATSSTDLPASLGRVWSSSPRASAW